MSLPKATILLAAAVFSTAAFAQTGGKTRAEVKAETRAAEKSGDVTAPGDTGLTERQRYPQEYASKPKKKHKTKKPATTSTQ